MNLQQCTDEAYLQDEEHPKSPAPPPTAQTAGPIGLRFLLGVHQRHRIGVTVAIFDFPSQTLKNGPPKSSGCHPPETQKIAKKLFLNFSFLFIGTCKGMFEFIQKHFLRQDLSFFLSFLYVLEVMALPQNI